MKKILPILLLLFCSCRTVHDIQTEYVEKTDTLYQTKWLHDSIHIRETVNTYTKGDTVYIEKLFTKYKEKLRTDTVTEVRTEIQLQSIETVREVNVLKWWQKALMWIGGAALVIGMAVAGWKIRRR